MNPHNDVPAPYGRCGDCNEIKQVTPGGVIQVHNQYRTSGTAVVASRCPGSDSPPVRLHPEELSA
jgi:hypothetical protein